MRQLYGYSAGLFAVTSALLFSPACGDDPTGSGGSGGGGSTSSSSSSTGGDPLSALQACTDRCQKLVALNCAPIPDCMAACEGLLKNDPAECQNESQAFYNCALLDTTTCAKPTACANEQEALDTCVKSFGCQVVVTCSGDVGMNGESICDCNNTCKGVKYAVNCSTPAAGGMATCDCLKDDVSVGSCMMADPGGTCAPKDTCCNTEYFKL